MTLMFCLYNGINLNTHNYNKTKKNNKLYKLKMLQLINVSCNSFSVFFSTK